MSCCNQDCRQGRDCPNRKEVNFPYIDWNTVGYALLIAMILGLYIFK